MMGEVRPARSVVPVATLHFGYLIELDAVAAYPRSLDDFFEAGMRSDFNARPSTVKLRPKPKLSMSFDVFGTLIDVPAPARVRHLTKSLT